MEGGSFGIGWEGITNPGLRGEERYNSPDRAPLANSAVVLGANVLVFLSSTSGFGMLNQRSSSPTLSITETTHMEFLRATFRKRFSDVTMDKMLRDHRPSSVRQ